mmetsp:Transcript_23671/g.65651  ORF Transcript_23671/g.65651 Transcript_23671/m.65651 type:complete len:250 (-) Transcript_23671:705-1454(-)
MHIAQLALRLYRKILEGVRDNGYNNLTERAYTSNLQKVAALPGIWWGAVAGGKQTATCRAIQAASAHWLGLSCPRRQYLNRLLAAVALDNSSAIEELASELQSCSPPIAPAVLLGTWDLLWSSPGSDYSRLRQRLQRYPVPVPSRSSQQICPSSSQSIVEVGPLRIVITATISKDLDDPKRTNVGPPYTFELFVGPFHAPLQFPPEFTQERTCLDTLYVDEVFKVSRVGAFGERTTEGSVFVHVKRTGP